MGIQNWSENIVLVDLPQEPEMGDELKAVIEIIRDRGDCEVVVDFSSVDIVTSSSLSKLCLLYTSPSPRDRTRSRMPSSA